MDAGPKRVRVLVVEDSLTVRRHIVDTLAADPLIEVVGEASDGKQAIAQCLALGPDAISMDMMMPVMSGLEATEYIMAHRPTPILIVSSSTNRGELFRTYDALAAGAVDVLDKLAGDEPDGIWEQRLRDTIRLVARIRVITHPRGRIASRAAKPVEASTTPAAGTAPPCALVAIGASTGGPAAIVEVLRTLPASYPLPVLLVLHINEPFGRAFAEWLDGQTALRVRYARDGEAIADAAGQVLMAPPDFHLEVQGGSVRLHRGPERHACRPSVDVLFESVATACGAQSVGCLLTGMGRDGAAGLLQMRRAGASTIAQNEATSVVWGMPGAAVALGAAERVLPIDAIGAAMAGYGARRNPR